MGATLTSAMLSTALFLGAVATIAAGAGTYETELLRGIDIYNFRSKCWGKKNVDAYALDIEKARRECMQMEPAFDLPGHGNGPQNPFLRPNNNPFEKLTEGGDFSDLQSLWRTKREAREGLLDVDEDDFYEFIQQVKDHRHLRRNSMSNLTCVLQKIGQLTDDMEVNLEYYTTALTAEEAEFGFTWDVEGSAAIDPEWRAKIAREYNDCYEMAQSLPAISLNRNPFHRIFGRQKAFFNCADRTERRVCTEAQLLENLEQFYGSERARRLRKGLPASAFRKTSTTPPPSLWSSFKMLSLRRRSSLKGSSGTLTETTFKEKNKEHG